MAKINWKERREDYSLQSVPDSYRHWHWPSLLSISMGIATAMFFMTWGGDLLQAYGFKALIISMIAATILIGSVAFLLVNIAVSIGLNSDLLTSACGLGYKGAGFSSLIYACNGVIFFAFEGMIMVSAIHMILPTVSLSVLYVITSLVFIPLTWYGITIINYIMWITLPLCILFFGWTIDIALKTSSTHSFSAVMPGLSVNHSAGPPLLQALATVLTLMAMACVACDIGRFAPKKERRITAFILGYVLNGVTFLGVTLLGAWLTFKFHQTNPGVYFPHLFGAWGALFVVITQLRINVLNAYGTSLALTTFFSRCFGFAPGRHWWVIIMVLLSMALMFGNILNHLTQVLTFESVFIIGWVMTVVSYLLFKKKLHPLLAERFKFQKGAIPNFNPIGVTALIIALLIAAPMAFGLLGPFGKTLAPFCSAGVAFILVPILSLFMKVDPA